MKRFAILAIALIAACELPPETETEVVPFVPLKPEVADSTDPCSAGSYLGLLGRNFRTVGLAEGEAFRFLHKGPQIGEQVIPTRLNAVVERNGMISQVYCG